MEQPFHGNYHGYYQTKRPALNDERIALLTPTFFRGKTVLDIGCNEGWVSCEIAQKHGASRVLGIDIDPTLISAAWKRRRAVWSQQAPSSSFRRAEDDVERPKKKLKTLPAVTQSHTHHFPLSMQHMFGHLPIPSIEDQDASESLGFPHNVSFRTSDWMTESDYREKYDVILALSITKWIHLNNGDDGLMAFFQRTFDALRPGCGAKLVLEPQNWDGYAKAKRMHPKLKENGKALVMRPDEFGEKLVQIGFLPGNRIGTVGEGGLRRPIDVYERP